MKHRTALQLLFAASLLVATCARGQAPAPRRIVISIPTRTLTVVEGERVVKTFDIAVGKPSTPTPIGRFQVVNRIPHPIWCAHGKAVPPGKCNPLGTRWIGLSAKGYGIHGTNEPESIGKAVSHGCIRLRNSDVEELFGLVDTGSEVELIGS